MVAKCSVDYEGRLRAHLPLATRLVMVKADGSVLIHSDGGSYKPLNWMNPPLTLREGMPDEDAAALGAVSTWTVASAKTDDKLTINFHSFEHDSAHVLGTDPGLIKDGVEADLQRLLAEQIDLLGDGHKLIRREYMTAIGPVDILARDAKGATVAVELKRRGDIDGTLSSQPHAMKEGHHVAVEIKRVAGIDAVEQLTRYLEFMNRDPLLAPVQGVLAAQTIKPQARTLAEDRGIRCLILDYDAMRGVDDSAGRLF